MFPECSLTQTFTLVYHSCRPRVNTASPRFFSSQCRKKKSFMIHFDYEPQAKTQTNPHRYGMFGGYKFIDHKTTTTTDCYGQTMPQPFPSCFHLKPHSFGFPRFDACVVVDVAPHRREELSDDGTRKSR